MKNKFPKIFLTAFIGILIFPQVSFAAWWNPLTWFQKPPVVEPISEDTTAPSLIKVSAETVSKIPAGESFASVPTVKPAVTKWWDPTTWFRKSESTSPVQPEVSTPTAKVQETKQPSEIEKLRSEVEELKKKVATPVSSATKPSVVVGDKSKATAKPVTPVAKPVVTATELRN